MRVFFSVELRGDYVMVKQHTKIIEKRKAGKKTKNS